MNKIGSDINFHRFSLTKLKKLTPFILVILLTLAACESGGSGDNDAGVPLSDASVPIDAGDLQGKFLSNAEYGDDSKQTFDLFMPKSDNPTPLVIHIHGGAFYLGDKDEDYSYKSEEIKEYLEAGIAFANINYRLLTVPGDTVGGIKSLMDGKRCLQFIRYNAEKYNIDKTKISMEGASAGAGISLWVGLSDDMADSTSDDPVERESTRVSAIGAIETQATYDLVQWEDIFEPFGVTLQGFATSNISMYYLMCAFYAMPVQTVDQLNTQLAATGIVQYREDLDMLALMTSDDPELFLMNARIDEVSASPDVDFIFHHPYHAKALMDTADAVGIDHVTYIPKLATPVADASGEDIVDFMIRKLN